MTFTAYTLAEARALAAEPFASSARCSTATISASWWADMTIPHWTDVVLARMAGPIRPASILRIAEPDSPESQYLREQATRLKDSRQMAERLAEEAAKGLDAETSTRAVRR